MAKDADKLIEIFEVLTSYRPVLVRHAPIPTPPPWAIELGVAQPMPTLTGPLPPWPIGFAITPDMQRVYDWLVQHRDQRDTDEYCAKHGWLAEQLRLSPDTLEPLRSSPPAPRPATSLPTEQTAEPPSRAESDASETAQLIHAGGAPPRLTDDEVTQLQAAYRAADPALRRRERKQLDVFEDLRGLLPEGKRGISDSTLRRIIVRPLDRP